MANASVSARMLMVSWPAGQQTARAPVRESSHKADPMFILPGGGGCQRLWRCLSGSLPSGCHFRFGRKRARIELTQRA